VEFIVAFQRKKPAAIGVKALFPGFIEPALATSIEKVPSGERWIHEIKFDGYRVQVHLVNEANRIAFRRGQSHAAAVADASCWRASRFWSSTPIAPMHSLIASPRFAATRSAFAPSRNNSNAAGSISRNQQHRMIVAVGNFRLRRRTE
jgi:hypothetical protein